MRRGPAGYTRAACQPPDEMPATTFEQAFNSGDIEEVLALYQRDAVLVPQPGQVVHGIAAIREALPGFHTLKPPIQLETQTCPGHGRARPGLEHVGAQQHRTGRLSR